MPLTGQIYCTSRCNHRCKICRVRSPFPGDADFNSVAKIISEFPKLFIPNVDFTGGDPLLWVPLPEAIKLSNKYRLWSSLTVSGPLMLGRGEDIFGLPNMLRISIDGDREYHNKNGHGYFDSIPEALKLAKRIRGDKKTQLIFTVVPGTDGNIKSEILSSVLSFAREHRTMINVNPMFDSTLGDDEMDLLLWFARQADVQMSRGKLRFVSNGGNNIQDPTCRGARSVVAISSDNYLMLPCYHHATDRISLNNTSLHDALNSQLRKNALMKQGRYDFCANCSIWCYMVPSWIILSPVRVVAWMHALSGLQSPRDNLLRLFGKLNYKYPYPLHAPWTS